MRRAVRSWTGAIAAALTAAAAFAALPAAGAATASEASVRNGEIIFLRQQNVYGQGYLWRVNADGTRLRRVLKSGWVSEAAWSPDGKRLLIVDKCAVKIMPAAGGKLRTILRPRTARNSLGQRIDECWWDPTWSPDGKRVALARCGIGFCQGGLALYVVNANGRGLRQMTQRECISGRLFTCPGVADWEPDWSPDGEKILFTRRDESLPDPPYGNSANNARLYLVDPDGSGLVQLPPEPARGGRWSPDGSRISFGRGLFTTLPPNAVWTGSIAVMNADGSNQRTLVQEDQGGGRSCDGHGGWRVAWSPDGSKLTYSGPCPQGVYVMNSDGSGAVRLTRGLHDTVLDWRPLP
jgi:dipeptidyl aminopeptidase/acylaminoacyl peptidase